MTKAVRVLLTMILVVVAGFLSYDMFNYYIYSPWTRDARVRADVVAVAPDVSGFIDDIRVKNDQFVQKGDVLFVIDQQRYRIALATAEATVAASLAQYEMLQDQYQRRTKLTLVETISPENLDNAKRAAESAAANHQLAISGRDLAALNLKRTEVRAPVNGFITNLNLATGTFASQGKPVMALIDSDSYRVDAYFEETKIPRIKAGAPAEIRLMNGAASLEGKVLGVDRGITDQDNHDGPELLSSVNPTFTWVRLAQRIPVRFQLTHVPPGVLISAGMTCTVIMKDGVAPHFGGGIRKALAALW